MSVVRGAAIGWDDVPVPPGVEPDVARRRVLEALWRDALGDPSVSEIVEPSERSFCEELRALPLEARLAALRSLTDAAPPRHADWERELGRALHREYPGHPESGGWSFWDRLEARFTGRFEPQERAPRVSPSAEQELVALHTRFAASGLGEAFVVGAREAISGYAGTEIGIPDYRTGVRRCALPGLPVNLYSRGGSRVSHVVAALASVHLPALGFGPQPRSAPTLLVPIFTPTLPPLDPVAQAAREQAEREADAARAWLWSWLLRARGAGPIEPPAGHPAQAQHAELARAPRRGRFERLRAYTEASGWCGSSLLRGEAEASFVLRLARDYAAPGDGWVPWSTLSEGAAGAFGWRDAPPTRDARLSPEAERDAHRLHLRYAALGAGPTFVRAVGEAIRRIEKGNYDGSELSGGWGFRSGIRREAVRGLGLYVYFRLSDAIVAIQPEDLLSEDQPLLEEPRDPCELPEERALLRAIRRGRQDPGARLVYADWLVARGDERGEVVVLEELVREGRATLEQRERLLLLAARRGFPRYLGEDEHDEPLPFEPVLAGGALAFHTRHRGVSYVVRASRGQLEVDADGSPAARCPLPPVTDAGVSACSLEEAYLLLHAVSVAIRRCRRGALRDLEVPDLTLLAPFRAKCPLEGETVAKRDRRRWLREWSRLRNRPSRGPG